MSPFVGNASILAVFLELGFVTLWIAAGSAQQRRSHFWGRMLLASLVVPALMAALVELAGMNVLSGGATKAVLSLFIFLGVVGLMLVPGVLYERMSPPSGPSESDGGGGSGPGPPRPPSDAPRGGIPLPDAEQARGRMRDHTATRFDEVKMRRPAHEPGRSPARTHR